MWLCLNGTCRTVNDDSATVCTACGSAGLQLRLFSPGTQIGDYEIRRFVGHGGYGVVYEAVKRDPDGKMYEVALKQTSLSDFRALERELGLLQRVNHPNLPKYYEAFQINGSGYLAMEFVHGLNLRELLTHAGNPLGERQVLQYAVELCSAVATLHAQKPPLLHRDIKPANIRLMPDGKIKLVDFGLTKEGTEETRTTQQGATLGYAPIEQVTGMSKTDERSDIYSIGATLYHLLTNQVPTGSLERGFQGTDRLIAAERLNPALRPEVGKVVRKAMDRRQEGRYPTVVALQNALQGLLGTPATAPKGGSFSLVWLLLGMAVLLLVGGWGLSYVATQQAAQPTEIAVVVDSTATAGGDPATPTTESGGDATATIPADSTPDAEGTAVVLAPTPEGEATATESAASPTPEAEPTETAVPETPTATVPANTPTPVAPTERGELLYSDTFNDNDWNWYQSEDGGRRVANGVYRIDQTRTVSAWREDTDPYIAADAPTFGRAPSLTQSYEAAVQIFIPPEIEQYAIGFDANLQNVTVGGVEEYASHTFTVWSDGTWHYAGGTASANVVRDGQLLTHVTLQDGRPHQMALRLYPYGDSLQMVLLLDGEIVALESVGAAPVPELEPLFREPSGTIALYFGITSEMLEQMNPIESARVAAQFDNLEIYELTP